MADSVATDAPRKAGAGIKGALKKQPKWVWAVAGIVLVGVAYVVYRNNQSTAADPGMEEDVQDYGPLAGGELGSGYVYAAPTQGAAYGYSDYPADDTPETAATPIDALAPIINIFAAGPGTTPGVGDAVGSAPGPASQPSPTQKVTGGGPPARSKATHSKPPKNVVKNGKFYHVYDEGGPKERWVFVREAGENGAKQVGAPTSGGTQSLGGGGGAPKPAANAPKNVTKNGKFYHVYNYGTSSERWVYVRKAS